MPRAYRARIWQHFEKPLNAGRLDVRGPGVGSGRAGTPEHGVQVRIQVRLGHAGAIEDARFKAQGPVALIACASLAVARLLDGEASEPDAAWLADALELAPTDRAAAVLVEDAWRDALADARRRRAGDASG